MRPCSACPVASAEPGYEECAEAILKEPGDVGAGRDAPELFANDATRKQLTFHDLRGTGITWLAIGGTEPLKIALPVPHATKRKNPSQDHRGVSGASPTGFEPVLAA